MALSALGWDQAQGGLNSLGGLFQPKQFWDSVISHYFHSSRAFWSHPSPPKPSPASPAILAVAGSSNPWQTNTRGQNAAAVQEEPDRSVQAENTWLGGKTHREAKLEG